MLRDLGHWLKGSAGSVGFHEFDEPGLELEILAKACDEPGLRRVVAHIQSLTDRVLLSYPECREQGLPTETRVHASSGGVTLPLPERVTSTLSDNPRLRQLADQFVLHLGEQIERFDQALNSRDLHEVGRLAHWLKGSAGTVGFGVFTEHAAQLEVLAKEGNSQQALEKLDAIRALYQRIELPLMEEPA